MTPSKSVNVPIHPRFTPKGERMFFFASVDSHITVCQLRYNLDTIYFPIAKTNSNANF